MGFKGYTSECMYLGVGIPVSYSLGHPALTMVDPHFLHEIFLQEQGIHIKILKRVFVCLFK